MEKSYDLAIFNDDGTVIMNYTHTSSLNVDQEGNLFFIVFKNGARREVILSSRWKWIVEEEK